MCEMFYGADRNHKKSKKYNYDDFTYDNSITKKIAKLEAMTIERGASEQEAESAKMMIARLKKKAEEATENRK